MVLFQQKLGNYVCCVTSLLLTKIFHGSHNCSASKCSAACAHSASSRRRVGTRGLIEDICERRALLPHVTIAAGEGGGEALVTLMLGLCPQGYLVIRGSSPADGAGTSSATQLNTRTWWNYKWQWQTS